MNTQNERLRALVAEWRKESGFRRGVGRRIYRQFADELEAEILAEDKGTGQGEPQAASGALPDGEARTFTELAREMRLFGRQAFHHNDETREEVCDLYAAKIEKLLAALAVPPSTGEPERGWLIELDRGDGPEWLCYDGLGMFDWTKDSIKATRFSRRQDADGVGAIFDDLPVRITEHQWGM